MEFPFLSTSVVDNLFYGTLFFGAYIVESSQCVDVEPDYLRALSVTIAEFVLAPLFLWSFFPTNLHFNMAFFLLVRLANYGAILTHIVLVVLSMYEGWSNWCWRSRTTSLFLAMSYCMFTWSALSFHFAYDYLVLISLKSFIIGRVAWKYEFYSEYFMDVPAKFLEFFLNLIVWLTMVLSYMSDPHLV